jgi:hypothetical protein
VFGTAHGILFWLRCGLMAPVSSGVGGDNADAQSKRSTIEVLDLQSLVHVASLRFRVLAS